MFGLALFVSGLFLLVPGAATAPALILVGVFMMSPVKEINFSDITESVPAFLTMVMMPLAYSIAEGIVWGLTSFVLLKVLSGKAKEVGIATYIVAAIFVLKFFIG
jgi:AGZA family xanthine/uracil permease-like MFS transporter